MVRTRKMGCRAADDAEPVLPSRDYRHVTAITADEEEPEFKANDSDESDYMPVGKRRKICRSTNSKDAERTRPKNTFTNALGELVTGSRTLRHQRKLPIVDGGGGEPLNGDDSGIRRSTRQRKSTYDSLNQTWLLSCAQMRDYPIYVNVEVPSAASGSLKPKKEVEDESSRSVEDFEDMYSRVKRARSKGNFYGLDTNGNRSNEDGSDDEGDGGEDDDDQEVDDESGSNLDGIGQLAEETSEGIETHDEDSRGTKYYLRQKKPNIERFQIAIEPQRQRKQPDSLVHLSPRRLRASRSSFRSPLARRSPHHAQRRHATHNSSSSSSSSCSSSGEDDRDERRFERRKSKSMVRSRSRCLPLNFTAKDVAASSVLRDRKKIGSSLADVDPMCVDRTATFESIGGHDNHIQSLKEMLLLPLMYPEVFEKLKITPPRGVLFYGPPGTGKTLVARALANECSHGERRVAFFMRKGADCLSKWVGESERQLRVLFDQAYSMRPSIIFFDEIDGLAPVRSARQDQIHSSIVSTLLALMDGLDGRGEVVVIGATNRIDAIDPALRRPGRFDREFNFSLPSVESRLRILRIHTRDWIPPLSDSFLEELAEKTVGFCGADLKALCAESAFLALRRRYPQIYQSRQKLQLDVSSIKIEAKDFHRALCGLVPASQRSTSAPGRPLNPVVRPLLLVTLNRVLEALKTTFPQGFATRSSIGNVPSNDFAEDHSSDEDHSEVVTAVHGTPPNGISLNIGHEHHAAEMTRTTIENTRDSLWYLPSHRPRMLLVGFKGQGQSTHVAPAILHHLERFPTHKLDLPALYAVTAKSPEESCSQIFLEAQRNLPAILYLPHVSHWWDTLTETVRATFLTLLNDLETTSPLLLMATSDGPFDELAPEIQELFDRQQGEVMTMTNPTKAERWQFFSDLILYETKRKPKCRRKRTRKTEKLPLAPPVQPRVLSEKEMKKIRKEEEGTLTELRLFLRDILYKLARDRRFSIFTKPVDTSEVTDYLQVIREPMDLETMMSKIDLHKYEAVADFLDDINLICQNALEYNPDREPSDKIIRHRACALRDATNSLVFTDLDPDFEQTCIQIREARKLRGESPTKYAPNYYHTLPKFPKIELGHELRNTRDTATDVQITDEKQSNHCDLSESEKLTTEVAFSKRTSRRVRGLDTQETGFLPMNTKGSSVRPRPRRRQVLWFGQQRRLKKPARIDSCSEDSHDGVALADKTGHNLMNGKDSSTMNHHDDCDPSLDETVESGLSVVLESETETTIPNDPLASSSFFGKLIEKTNNVDIDVSEKLDSNPPISASSLERKTPTPSNIDVGDSEAKEDSLHEVMSPTNDGKSDVMISVEAAVSEEIELESIGNDDQDVEPMQTTVTVDQSRLRHLLEMVVTRTENANVETLQKLHCRLYQIVRSNRKEWDKSNLLDDLEKEIERITAS